MQTAITRRDFPDATKLPVNTGWPDPLVNFDGTPVRARDDWFAHRVPELKALFSHYMYGYTPPPASPRAIRARVERTNPRLFDGLATLKQIAIDIITPRTDLPAPRINLILIVPNRRSAPAPAFLGLNFCGNHGVTNDPDVPVCTNWTPMSRAGIVDHQFTSEGRGQNAGSWCPRTLVERGYALATYHNGDLDPDKNDLFDGIHAHYHAAEHSTAGHAAAVKADKSRQPNAALAPVDHAANDWGTIAAWAWGLSRAMDYLVTDGDIDAKRVAVMGHSRNGKTALLAAAMDERFAMSIPIQAGCGGTAPSRGNIGETVYLINRLAPHWFNGNFKLFDGACARLPFDQHCLAALVAPRPVLFSNALDDQWANPWGQFDALQHADPAYRFLGVEGLNASRMPELGQLVNSRLGYYWRPDGHEVNTLDWEAFLAFADKHM